VNTVIAYILTGWAICVVYVWHLYHTAANEEDLWTDDDEGGKP
jgi:hypothetical protein